MERQSEAMKDKKEEEQMQEGYKHWFPVLQGIEVWLF